MHKHLKLKLALPVLAVAISTSALAANNNPVPTQKDNLVVASLSPNARERSTDEMAAKTDNAVQGGIPGSHAAAGTEPGQSDTCMGSKSSGIQLPMVGGVTFGSSWTDKNCMMIKNARELWNMGFKTAALARMCMDEQNREALESTGTPCPARREDAAARRPESSSLAYRQ